MFIDGCGGMRGHDERVRATRSATLRGKIIGPPHLPCAALPVRVCGSLGVDDGEADAAGGVHVWMEEWLPVDCSTQGSNVVISRWRCKKTGFAALVGYSDGI